TAKLAALGINGEIRSLTPAGSSVTGFLRHDSRDARRESKAVVVLINSDLQNERRLPFGLDPLPPAAAGSYTATGILGSDADPKSALKPGEVRLLLARRNADITASATDSLARFARPAARIVIDNVTPSVDDGRFPAKCVVGDAVAIAADIFMDG